MHFISTAKGTLPCECYSSYTCCPANSYFYTTYTPDTETHSAASSEHLWQNQAVVTHLKGTWGWQLPNSKTEPLANHVILLADQSACQVVRFTCRLCDRFAKHASLTGNGVTTHRHGMQARWLTAKCLFLCGNPGLVPQLSFETTHWATCAGCLKNSMFFCFFCCMSKHGAMFLIRAVFAISVLHWSWYLMFFGHCVSVCVCLCLCV